MTLLATAPIAGQPIPLTHRPPEWSAPQAVVLPYIPVEMKADRKIDIVIKACTRLDRHVKTDTVALIRQLIATRHIFSGNKAQGSGQEGRVFDLYAPIQNFWISYAGVRNRLHEISPALAEQRRIVESIRNIANHSSPGKQDKRHLRNVPLTKQEASKNPQYWSKEAILYILRLGNWDQTRLAGAKLQDSDLRDIQWGAADLRGAHLERSDMTGGVLNGARLEGSHINNCLLDLAELCLAKLNDCTADGASFVGANLSQADGTGGSFLKAKFENATAAGTILKGARLSYSTGLPITQGVLLDDAELYKTQFDSNMKNRVLFQHLDNFVESLLFTLSTITRDRDNLHNDVLWEMIKATGADFGRLKNIGALAKALLTQDRCWNDEQLKQFIDTRLLPIFLSHWNTDKSDKHDLSPRQVVPYIISAKPTIDWPKYGGAICQMLIDAEFTQNIEQRNALCAELKKHPAIAWIVASMAKQKLGRFEDHSVFIAPNFKSAMIYTNIQILEMLNGTGRPYSGCYLVRNSEGYFIREKLQNLDTIKTCKVPIEMFNIDLPPAGAVALLKHIFEGSTVGDKFIHALTCRSLTSEENVVNSQNPTDNASRDFATELDTAYKKIMRRNHMLSVPDSQILWEKFSGTGIGLKASNENISRMLMCFAALLDKHAGRDMIGRDIETHITTLSFSVDFLNTSLFFDPSLCEKEDLMSEDIAEFLIKRSKTDPALATCFKAIYPQAWLPESAPQAAPRQTIPKTESRG